MNPLDQARQEIANNSTIEKKLKEEMLRLIKFLEKNPTVKYFPLTKIKKITKSECNESILNIAIYFCGERTKLFEPRYCYILDNENEIELTRNEFKHYLINRKECLNKDGELVFPVIRERLMMYFTTNISISSDSNDSDDWDIE